jgi:hypothetical protein
VEVVRPVAKGLDILQGDDVVSLGYLLPTLTKILSKLDKFASATSRIKLCKDLAKVLANNIRRRFDEEFAGKTEKLASFFHPRYSAV